MRLRSVLWLHVALPVPFINEMENKCTIIYNAWLSIRTDDLDNKKSSWLMYIFLIKETDVFLIIILNNVHILT